MPVVDRLAALFPAPDQVPPAVRLPGPIEQRVWLVDGTLRAWAGPTQDVMSPIHLRTATGLQPTRLGCAPLLTEVEALAALDAACRAWDQGRGPWPTMRVEERIRHVEAFATAMRQKRTEVVNLLQWEIAKSRGDAEKEFDRTLEYVRDTVEALKELDRSGARLSLVQGVFAQIRRAPLGVVLCMGPFNYPLNETFTTLIPALIMGNPVIFKPAKIGVLLWQPLLEALRDSFPPGVVNAIYGDGRTIISPLMASGKIDVLAFIGSSRVASALKKQHPRPHRLRSILGLEAKNAALVLADADLDLAVRECVLGSLSYNGQRCTALKMLFVQRTIFAEFAERYCAAVGKLTCGMPWDAGVALTPLAEPGKPEYFQAMVADCAKFGGRVLNENGGAVAGSFFYPAVISPVTPEMRLYHEEQFGPVVPLAPFDDLAQPLRYVEESSFGQQVSIFGRDPDQLARLIDPLANQVCRVNLNSQCQRGPDAFPFAGRKDSAEGTLSVTDALRCFSIRSLVAAKDLPANKEVIAAILHGRKSKFLSTDYIL